MACLLDFMVDTCTNKNLAVIDVSNQTFDCISPEDAGSKLCDIPICKACIFVD